MDHSRSCPDCSGPSAAAVSRRQFVQAVGATAAAAALAPSAFAREESPGRPAPETLVAKLYETLTPEQQDEICFEWDHADDRTEFKLPLRQHVSNNWHITSPTIASDFFTGEQQDLIEAIFYGLYNPDWHDRIRKQLRDDAGGYGKYQNIALFGEPGTGKFEFVMTGRHLTIRCDGDSNDHVAFGGPIFYGHAAEDFHEKSHHPGNVFWHQALKANALFQMLDGKQRKAALVRQTPAESAVHFQGPQGRFPGIPVAELSSDQQEHLRDVLETLIEPYRTSDQDEVRRCLKAQGGLEKCSLAYYEQGDIGEDGVWDNWRLEGPSFVWYFRGEPHVHVWVNIASDPSVEISTHG